jgi:hypothetical protein
LDRHLVSCRKSSIFSCDLRRPGCPMGMIGGAAGVDVRQMRGDHLRLACATISGNISNLFTRCQYLIYS